MMRFVAFIVILNFLSCGEEKKPTVEVPKKDSKNLNMKIEDSLQVPKNGVNDSMLLELDLVDVQTINGEIMVDIKYSTTDNFMKEVLYERINKAYLLKDVAIRLGKCQDYLTELNPELHLLVYDAVRPVSVQRKMWNALDTIPVKERGKFVSSPYGKSVHNYGAAIDLTICDKNGIPLDMGAGFDDIREIAYPSKEAYYLEKGELTSEQVANRQLLRKVMRSQGFRNLQTEWWHFNAFSRKDLIEKYKPIEFEP